MTAPISKQSEKGRFCSASCKMVVSLMTYKAFFQELERSSNLHPTGRTAVSLRQLRNAGLTADRQAALPGVGTKCQSPSSRKKAGFTASAAKWSSPL